MKTDDIIVKHSTIHGKGVFAKRDFKVGEIVMHWDKSNILTTEEFNNLTDNEKRYVSLVDGIYIQMQAPEKYVNHSCDSNTTAKNFCDIASREIKKGEEITANYINNSSSSLKYKCNCGSKKCSETDNG